MSFHPVANLDDLPIGEAVGVVVGGTPVALARLSGDDVRAIHNVCSHENYPLAPEGWIEDGRIECALHGSMFCLTTGRPDALPASKVIPLYAVEVQDGTVLVDVARQLNAADAPLHQR